MKLSKKSFYESYKSIKNLGYKLKLKNVYAENYETLLREIKDL